MNGYDFSKKKDKIKELFDTPEYRDYKEEKDKVQKRKEKTYKITSIGNSTLAVKTLILVNVFLFIISYFVPSLVDHFALYPLINQSFAFYQILTSMFLHGGFIHVAINMFVLWSFGNQTENVIGAKKFLQLYFFSGILSSILWLFLGIGPAVGASGALSGLLAAYLIISPDSTVYLFFMIPIKIKKLIYGFAIFSLVFGLLSLINPALGFGVGHFAHLGGLIGGYLIANYWNKRKMIRTF